MSPKRNLSTEERVELILTALEDKKAIDPAVIDVRGRTSMADVFIIASGTSRIHIRSLADAVIEKLADEGIKNKKIEGITEGTWILLDYGDIVIHVFAPEQREFYRIEAYWSGAEKGSPPPLSPSEV
ncbi:MAG: ribosome silencing factor [Armatimonadota bacterium]